MDATTTLVLGGGFGGIAAANTLRHLLPREHAIAVVDHSPTFHVGAGKTWVALGDGTAGRISRPRAELLARGVEFALARVISLDVAGRRIETSAGPREWDHLVIALGADVDMAALPGLETAYTFYTLDGAERLRPALEKLESGDLALVIARAPFRCPPAPYEAAMLFHDSFERRGVAARIRTAIWTAEPAPMPTAGPAMGQYIREQLAQRGIAYHPSRKLSRVDPSSCRVHFEDGGLAPYDLLVVVPPHVAPACVRDAGLCDASGWIPVDPKTLEPTAFSGRDGSVVAIGDVASVALPGRYKPDVGLSLPKAGVFAESQGRVVARRLAARVLGKEPDATFDGEGFCYLEVGARKAVRAEGSFFAMPHPTMRKAEADSAQLRDKHDWVERHLSPSW